MRARIQATILGLLLASVAFAQNASLGGLVSDPTGALLPGVTLTATNEDTGVSATVLSNESGAYNFPSLQPGPNYKVSASLTGFQSQTVTKLQLSGAGAVRQNFELKVGSSQTSIDVSGDRAAALKAESSSVGDVLTEDRIRNLPMVGNNVLDLLNILPGLRISPIGSSADTIGGLGISSINVTRDGLSVSDNRFNPEGDPFGVNGLAYAGSTRGLSTTVMNPDLVGEVRLILSPVDAELGRGNSQIQIQTRSGTNKFTGAAVWNIQNSALNANTWDNNRQTVNGVWTPTKPDWRNLNQITVSGGGPIIKNKTFFFVLYDQSISNTRQTQLNAVLTNEARNGIFRYWEGWVPDSADPVNNPASYPIAAESTVQSVDDAGRPLKPLFFQNGTSYTGSLVCFSVFGSVKLDGTPFGANDCPGGTDSRGNAFIGKAVLPNGTWDPKRASSFDSSGYFASILKKMPTANDFIDDPNGDGLNYAAFRWLLTRRGNNANESIVGTDAFSNRKQINLKVDQNFGKHRLSGNWTYQVDDNADNVGDWPEGLSGQTSRHPQVFTLNFTSTLSASLLNEARFGLNFNKTESVPAWLVSDKSTRDEAKSFLMQGGQRDGNTYPVVVAPTVGNFTFNTGVMETTTGVTQVGYSSPLYNYADTLSWTQGRHAFKFGADLRYPRTKGYNLQPYPVATYGNPTGATSTASPLGDTSQFTAQFGDVSVFQLAARQRARDMAYILTDSLASISMPYWIENYNDVNGGVWQDTTTRDNRFREQVSSEYAFFVKDDFKMTKHLTLNLGLRYEYYSAPYLRSGLTSTPVDQGNGLFGASRSAAAGGQLFDNWLQPGNLYLANYGNNANGSYVGGVPALSCTSGMQQSALLPVSTCDPNLMTNIEFIGPNSPNTNKTIFPLDKNNFGPAVGFAWQLPWFGEGKTSVRGGFQMTFARNTISENTLASALGASLTQNLSANDPAVAAILPTRALTVTDVPALVPLTPSRAPGQAVPIYARSASTTAYAPDYATPYTENLTLSVTRSINRNTTVDVRYIGTLARKQNGTLDLNTSTALYNPELFDALERARRGENPVLLDQLLAGLNLQAATVAGYGPVGTTVNGVLQTGGAAIRRFQTGNNVPNLANGNLVAVANALVTAVPTGLQTVAAGLAAAPALRLLRNGCDRIANGLYDPAKPASATNIPTRCFPENYLTANPQLTTATYNANTARSNYHALQVQVSARPVQGVSLQATYSWAKSMQIPGSFYTDPSNRNLDYARGREGPHTFRTNGTVELPIGPNKLFFGNSSGWVARAIEKWQTSFILNMSTGSPADVIGAQTTMYANGRYVATSHWQIPKGKVEWNAAGGASGTFYGTDYVAVRDPQCADTSTIVGTDNQGFNFGGTCNMNALAKIVPAGTPDSFILPNNVDSAVLVLVNPRPGEVGTLGSRSLDYWGQFSLDANISKSFRLTESKSLAMRVDTINVLNHPQPGIPNYTVGTGTFGAITTKTGSRTFQGQLRFSF
jgi:hypothetical protein